MVDSGLLSLARCSLDWILCERESWIKPFLCRAHRPFARGGRAKSGSKGCKGASEGERYIGGRGMLPTQQTDHHSLVFPNGSFRKYGTRFQPHSFMIQSSKIALKRSKIKLEIQTSELMQKPRNGTEGLKIVASWHLKLIKQLHFNFRFPATSHFTYPSLSTAIFRLPIRPPSLITMRTSGGQREDMRERRRADGRRVD